MYVVQMVSLILLLFTRSPVREDAYVPSSVGDSHHRSVVMKPADPLSLRCGWLGHQLAISSLPLAWYTTYVGSKRTTTTLLTKIVRVSVETGLICAMVAILDLSIFLSYPHNNFHVPLCMCLSKLYSNSLLAVSHGSSLWISLSNAL